MLFEFGRMSETPTGSLARGFGGRLLLHAVVPNGLLSLALPDYQ